MAPWLVLVGGFALSLALSVYAWSVRPWWALQLVAAVVMLVISYPLIFGGLGYLTGAFALGQLVLARRLYRQART